MKAGIILPISRAHALLAFLSADACMPLVLGRKAKSRHVPCHEGMGQDNEHGEPHAHILQMQLLGSGLLSTNALRPEAAVLCALSYLHPRDATNGVLEWSVLNVPRSRTAAGQDCRVKNKFPERVSRQWLQKLKQCSLIARPCR